MTLKPNSLCLQQKERKLILFQKKNCYSVLVDIQGDMKKLFLGIVACTVGLNALFALKAVAVADYISAGFSAANAANLKWTTDTATVTSNYLTTYITPASTKWNGITTKVNVVAGTSTVYKIRFLVGTNSIAAVKGLTRPYCAAGQGDACTTGTQTYTAARIYLYEANMAAENFSTDRRIACIAHELGHALSLKHTFSTEAPASAPSLMAGTLPATSTVQTLDKSNIKGRWGN
jgi:Pregnancy-associated plasma protein-A